MAREAAHSRGKTVTARPARQQAQTVRLPKSIATKAAYDEVLEATGNRPPKNDLYERINFLRTGRRTPLKPTGY